jgi:hypothetical protein
MNFWFPNQKYNGHKMAAEARIWEWRVERVYSKVKAMSSKDYKTIIEVVRKQNNKSCHLITTLQKSEIKDSLKLSEELDY